MYRESAVTLAVTGPRPLHAKWRLSMEKLFTDSSGARGVAPKPRDVLWRACQIHRAFHMAADGSLHFPMGDLPIKIAASLLLADYSRLGDELRALEAAGCDLVQWDVMDGHFVPQITFGPGVIEKCRDVTSMEFEAQLMIERPELTAADYVKAGCTRVIVHAESGPHVHRAIDLVRSEGASAGIALNPATPVSAAQAVLAEIDQILIMTIDPGAAGRPFQETSLARIAAARAIADGRHVEVDGGIVPETARRAAAAGANVLVAASGIFAGPYAETVAALRKAADEGRSSHELM